MNGTFHSATGSDSDGTAEGAPSASPARLSRLTGLLPALVLMLGALAIAAGAALVADSLERERAEVVRAGHAKAANLARAYTEYARQTVRRLDQALVQLRDEYADHGGEFLGKALAWKRTLYPDLDFEVSVADANGVLRYADLAPLTTRVEVGDRDHFRVHVGTSEDRLYIGKPVIRRVDGQPSIMFTRSVFTADGAFDGIVALGVAPGTLAGYFGTGELSGQGSAMLVGMDRIVRARASAVPQPADIIGLAIPDRPAFFDLSGPAEGVFETTSTIDGVQRIVAYRRLRDYPLVAVVGLGLDETLAPFRERRKSVLIAGWGLGGLAAAAILSIAWLLRQQIWHRERLEEAQRQLAGSEERWRLALHAVGDGVWDWNVATGAIFFSDGWKGMLGFDRNEIGDGFEEWERRLHPDDRDRALADIARHMAGEVPFYANEYRLRRKDGAYVWILARGVVVARRPDGSPARMVGTHTDITRQKRTEQALSASAARMSAILDSVPVGIVIVDGDRRMDVANPRTAEIFRCDHGALVGRSTRVLYGSDTAFDEVGRRFYPALGRGEVIVEELRMVRADGSRFWARIVGKRVSMAEPDQGIVWVVDDIDARKQADKALTASLAFQRVLIDTVPIPIFVRDAGGRYLDVNTAFENWIGESREGLRERSVSEVWPAEQARRFDAANRDLLRTRRTQVYEAKARHADGTDRDVEFSNAVFYRADGEPDGIVGAMVDITGRKRAEIALRERQELFERIFVSSSAVKLLIDPDSGTVVDANPSAADYYGYSLDVLRGMRISDLNMLSPDEVQTELWQAREAKRRYFLFRHRLASGEVRDVEVYSSPLEVNGHILLLSLVHDITERARTEEALRHKTAELERSNAELEAFAYVASHDLRQPLRTINSYLTLLKRDLDGTLDAEAEECIAFACSGAQRMDRLIVDLLEYSRVGRKTRPFAAHPAQAIVAAAVDNLDAAVAEASATITVAPDLPVLWGDDNELERLFQNLIGNAIKYRAEGRAPDVHVTCAPDDTGWRFTVADNGIGIGPEHFDRIFGIFQRLHGRDAYEGTGVGLAVCKKIVEHHGGRICVESEPGQGSRFHVVLPRMKDEAA